MGIGDVKGHLIGDKVGTRHMCFMVDKENKKLHCGYYALIQIDNQMMLVNDKDAPGGAINAPTRKEARKLAIEARDKLKAISEIE